MEADGVAESSTEGAAMKALVVFESMYGNTHVVADRVAEGLRSRFDVTVVPVDDATRALVAAADLLVCGGPTHVHSMTTTRTRHAAVDALTKATDLTLDPNAPADDGLREWFDQLGPGDIGAAAAFDTRLDAPAALTGRAAKGIARRLRHHGFHLVADPESFLVDKQNHLVAGEADRAEQWGTRVAEAAMAPILGATGGR
jgi:hypothetical protein